MRSAAATTRSRVAWLGFPHQHRSAAACSALSARAGSFAPVISFGDRGEGGDALRAGPAHLVDRLEHEQQARPVVRVELEGTCLVRQAQRTLVAAELELHLRRPDEQPAATFR